VRRIEQLFTSFSLRVFSVLNLDPVRRRLLDGPVRRGPSFRNDAFQVEVAHLLEKPSPVCLDVIDLQNTRALPAQEPPEPGFLLDQRQGLKILTVQMQHIEREEQAFLPPEQQVVEDRPESSTQAIAECIAVAGDQIARAVLDVGKRPKAVDLQLEDEISGIERFRTAGKPDGAEVSRQRGPVQETIICCALGPFPRRALVAISPEVTTARRTPECMFSREAQLYFSPQTIACLSLSQ